MNIFKIYAYFFEFKRLASGILVNKTTAEEKPEKKKSEQMKIKAPSYLELAMGAVNTRRASELTCSLANAA